MRPRVQSNPGQQPCILNDIKGKCGTVHTRINQPPEDHLDLRLNFYILLVLRYCVLGCSDLVLFLILPYGRLS